MNKTIDYGSLDAAQRLAFCRGELQSASSMTDRMRAQFEQRFPLPPGVFWHSVQNTYVGEAGWKLATDRWEAWQESRATLVVEWPDQHTYTVPDVAGAAILDCRTAFGKATRANP